jgi:leucyl-tRNA synthetase
MEVRMNRKVENKRNTVVRWPAYSPAAIERKWQERWEQQGLYRAQQGEDKPKFYCLDFFPYPSGEGLHVGHCRNYVPTDVLSRVKRMQGFNVLHPMGWDAFGEPAEQFASSQNTHPRVITDRSTANFRCQMTMIGTSYDWEREIDSSRPEFYRWTQWFFILLYKRGLAYRDTNWQWWCPTCQTTLSSHEAVGGVCWRGHSGITRREIPAWYFKITQYAEELLSGLDELDWPERIKAMQRNWIGRSEGCEIVFQSESGQSIPVFTTRPDTLFGATFFALAPEHPLVMEVTQDEHRARVETYIAHAMRLSEVDRMVESRPKTGVFTGRYVINPLSGERLPIWVADYVLPSYGKAAVMGVPAHDERDFEFARRYELPVKAVIKPVEEGEGWSGEVYTGHGEMINSGPYDGLPSQVGSERIASRLSAQGAGGESVQYRMRGWLISRQRYWGTPIPIIYCRECGEMPVPEEQLPVSLPPMDDFLPDGSGRSPLARLENFVETTCPGCGGPAQRETDTMGGFACSSWYFLRFTSPHYHAGPFEPEAMRYWMPVDLYVGGAEHAVLHLLYARFWTRVLADAGLVPFREPFTRLLTQGDLLGPDGQRMSKSRGNTIPPDGMVKDYGADALRVYELFMAPFDQTASWSTTGINGARRFVERIWNLYRQTYFQSLGSKGDDDDLRRQMHRTIRQVSERIEGFRFNTMVSALMEFVNALVERQKEGSWRTRTYHQSLETLMVLLAPVTPHLTEELWQLTGHTGSIHRQPWPAWDAELAREETVALPVQVDGKVRQVIELPQEADKEEVEAKAFADPKVAQHLQERVVIRSIYIPGKILNLVTAEAIPDEAQIGEERRAG